MFTFYNSECYALYCFGACFFEHTGALVKGCTGGGYVIGEDYVFALYIKGLFHPISTLYIFGSFGIFKDALGWGIFNFKEQDHDGDYIHLGKEVALLPFSNNQKFIVIGVVI